jgi:hypothetical protein
LPTTTWSPCEPSIAPPDRELRGTPVALSSPRHLPVL